MEPELNRLHQIKHFFIEFDFVEQANQGLHINLVVSMPR